MPVSPHSRLSHFATNTAVRRSVIGIASLLMLYGIFGAYILPLIIKSQAEKLAVEKLHRQITIGKVAVNPFALTLSLHDIKLMEPSGGAVFIAFDELTINASSYSLARLAPVIQEVRLTKPYVHLRRTEAHHYNIDDIIELIASQPPSTEPVRFSVNNIQIENGRVEFEDVPLKATHAVTDITLGVPFVSSLASDVKIFVEPLLSAKVNGAPLIIKGKAHPFSVPKEALVQLDLDDIEITRYLGYLPFQPRFKLASARADVHLTANFQQSSDKTAALVLSGGATLKSVQVLAPDGKPALKLPELAISLGKSDLFGSKFDITRVFVNGLEADVTRRRDGSLSLLGLLPESPPKSAPAATPAAQPASSSLQFVLGEVEVRGAALRYTNEQAVRPMQANIEKFDAAIDRIAVDTGKRTVAIEALRSGSGGFQLLQGKPRLAGSSADPIIQSDIARKAIAQDTPTAKTDAAYAINVRKIEIANWSLRLDDRSQNKPVVTTIAPLSVAMQNLSTAASPPSPIELKATVNKTGQMEIRGKLGLTPMHADLALDMKDVDILAVQPYITDHMNLLLTRASLSTKGALQLNQARDGAWRGGFKGDVTLGNVATVDKLGGSDFIRWKSLLIGGIAMRVGPFALAVDQIALKDFFARVIIDSTGRINLQDILRNHPDGQKTLTEAGETSSPALVSMPAKPDAKQASSSTALATEMPPVKIGKFTLEGGKVRYTDNFIKPNYTANLMNLGGVVSGLSSDPSSSANVDLHGEVNNAPLAIAGRVNPLKGDLSLDIKANVRGMELAPLSPYSGRYAGYGIDKGKLSFEVAYQIENRKLTAQNRLILDQLRFGDKVDSPSATTLPVRFAVALLQDRHGVIDIDLPIAGSLDDPQFSMGGIIVKVIVNLLTKAITQPFALLGSSFGGGEELSALEFDAGHFAVSPAAETKLKSLAKALIERPALTLDITGRTDPEADRAGLQRAAIDRKVRAMKSKDMAARGEAAEPGSTVVAVAEYPALLTRVYKDENFTKPRNVLGMQKDLPVEEMEKAIIAHTVIGDDDLIALGNRRAEAVKTWLLKNGGVPAERIFIVAAKAGVSEANGKGSGLRSSRVDFSLR